MGVVVVVQNHLHGQHEIFIRSLGVGGNRTEGNLRLCVNAIRLQVDRLENLQTWWRVVHHNLESLLVAETAWITDSEGDLEGLWLPRSGTNEDVGSIGVTICVAITEIPLPVHHATVGVIRA